MPHHPQAPRAPRGLAFVPISGLLLLGAWFTISQAQVQTAIRPDGTLGTAVTQTGSLYEITGGTRPGNGPNLFHSFDRFRIGTGDTARFTGPTGIANILSRVTGGEQSLIDGRLQSTIPGANVYLLNPSGVLFGPNASLDVRGSFYVSTADYLRLGDGGIFSANLSEKSTLTVAPPVAFGFLRENPAGIAIQGSTLTVSEGRTISVVGGDIKIAGRGSLTNLTDTLSASSGRINLLSVASPGEVMHDTIDIEALDRQIASFSRLGEVSLSQLATVSVNGDGSGTVVIRGGRLSLDFGGVFAHTARPADGSSIDISRAGIDIQVAEDAIFDNGSVLGTLVFRDVATGSGGIRIRANHMEVSNGADIRSATVFGSFGDGGDIEVKANSVLVKDRGMIGARALGSGTGGDIVVRAESLEVRDRGNIFTLSDGGSGNGGNIDVRAAGIRLSNIQAPGFPTGISTETRAIGKAGDNRITTGNLQILEGAELSAATFGPGQGGNIEVRAGNVSISGSNDSNIVTGIFTNTFGSGHGGHLNLQANSLTLTNRATLQAATFGQGNAGGATVTLAGRLEIRDASSIFTNAVGGTGNAADLNVTAQDIFISGISTSRTPDTTDFTGLSTATNIGKGGDMHITAANLHVADKGQISSFTEGSGRAGNITLRVSDSIRLTDGGQITALTSGTGEAGNIDVLADRVTLSGVNSTPIVVQTSDRAIETVSPAAISTQTQLRGGKAGNIQLRATSLQVLDGASIDAQTFSAGQGGDIDIQAETIVISGTSTAGSDLPTVSHPIRSSISTVTDGRFMGDAATGKAGNIRLQAGALEVRDGSLIRSGTTAPGSAGNITITANRMTLVGDAGVTSTSTSSSNAGKAGNIAITARDMFQSDNSTVSTAAEQAEGGAVTIEAGRIQLRNGSRVSARSAGVGDAGRLTLIATDSFLSENSTITTEATQADGGNIQVTAQSLVRLRNSEITATVGGGPETVGGNITIDPESVVLENSQIRANAFAGRGGNIQITAGVFLADPASQLTVSSALGIDGEVDSRTLIADLSGIVILLPQQFAQAAALLRNRCAARLQEGNVSSLVERGRDGMPANPDGVLPSRLYKAHAESNKVPQTGRQAKRTTAPSQPGLSREADGHLQIKDWPILAGSRLAWERECAGR